MRAVANVQISTTVANANPTIKPGIGIREIACADAETTATINNVPLDSISTKKSASEFKLQCTTATKILKKTRLHFEQVRIVGHQPERH